MKLGRDVRRHNELDNWRNTHRYESVMATIWLLLTISETDPGLWDRLSSPLFSVFHRLMPDHRRVRLRQHRQDDVTVPAIPPPDLGLVQAHPRLREGRLCPLASSKHSSMVHRVPLPMPVPPGWSPPGHNRRSRPVLRGWPNCGGPAANSPCRNL